MKQLIFDVLDALNLRMNFIYPRPWQKWALNKHLKGKELIGVEVGVLKGRHSKYILKRSNVKKLYCVDSYLHYEEYPDYLKDNLSCYEKIAHKRLARFGNKVVWIKKKSLDAIDDIPNELDFVYLDGNHTHEYVKKELELYYPKLRKGGVLAGHDSFKLDINDSCVDVVQAVMEFAVKHNLQVFFWHPDFWIFKK